MKKNKGTSTTRKLFFFFPFAYGHYTFIAVGGKQLCLVLYHWWYWVPLMFACYMFRFSSILFVVLEFCGFLFPVEINHEGCSVCASEHVCICLCVCLCVLVVSCVCYELTWAYTHLVVILVGTSSPPMC